MRRFPLLMLLGGCAAVQTVQSNGFTLSKKEFDAASRAVLNRAAFEMNCPKEKLQVSVLNTNVGFVGDAYGHPQQIGVEGCGTRFVYVENDSGWVLNTPPKRDTDLLGN